MTRLLTYTFSVAMAAVTLVASLGLSINRMDCLSSGRTTVSLFPIDDCCDADAENTSVQPRCCLFSSMEFKVDVPAVTPRQIPIAIQSWAAAPTQVVLQEHTQLRKWLRQASNSSPPAATSKFIYILLQSFRI